MLVAADFVVLGVNRSAGLYPFCMAAHTRRSTAVSTTIAPLKIHVVVSLPFLGTLGEDISELLNCGLMLASPNSFRRLPPFKTAPNGGLCSV